MIIAISGPSGSGKSTLSRYLQSAFPNVCHIEVDNVIGNVLLHKKDLLARTKFRDTRIDSKFLKKISNIFYNYIFFGNPKITTQFLKLFEKKIDGLIEQNKDKTIIIDFCCLQLMPKYLKMADRKIFVTADKKTLIRRVMLRDNDEYKEIKKRQDIYEQNIYDVSGFDFVMDTTNSTVYHQNGKKLLKVLHEDEKLCPVITQI